MLTQAHQALIYDDTRKPGRKLCVALKLPNVLIGFPARILHLVFCIFPVSQYGSCKF
jgi:hypothetical protein